MINKKNIKKQQIELQLQAKEKLENIGTANIDYSHQVPTTDKLLQEILARYIDLEIQNEELKHKVTSLEISRKHYSDLYDFAPVAYLTLNKEGIITEINLTGALLFGMEREQLLNSGFTNFIAPEDIDRWHFNFLNAQLYNRNQQCELTLSRANSNPFHAYLDYIYKDTVNTPSMLHIMLTDVTEQTELRDYDEVYRSILATTLDGFWMFNSDGKLLDVNSRYSDQSGYSRKDLLEMSIYELEAVETANDIRTRMQQIIDIGSDQFESMHQRKDGTIWHVDVSITYLDCNGGRFYAFLRDISKRKQSEEETREINAALKVLLRQRETDKINAQNVLSLQAEGTVLPFLNKLKKFSIDNNQRRLFEILESNLQHLIKTYGRSDTLSSAYQLLTPVEIQVASMVRQNLSTKHIASTLHISQGTVSIHRKHIRKKLGLDGKATNLSSYLLSLAE